ncbi:MAG: hypothetical protein V1882_07405 [Candidatus Omnitrophota bacterium]
MNEDEELPDWEVKDEEPPERLQKKWEQEETGGHRTVLCRACKKETSSGNLTCVFCGSEIFEENALDRLLNSIKRFFRKS